ASFRWSCYRPVLNRWPCARRPDFSEDVVMRSYGLTFVALLVLAPLATTQTPPPGQSPIIGVPGTGAPNQDTIDRHLKNWETRMKGVESILAKLERIETAVDGTIRKLSGEARYLKPNYAALRMIR